MKITSILFEKKVTKEEKDSLGQYSNETLKLEATINEEDNRDLAILNLMELVHAHLGVTFKSPIKDAIGKMAAKGVKEDGEKGKSPAKQQSKQVAGSDTKEKVKAVKEKEVTKEVAPKKEVGTTKKADTGTEVQGSGEEKEVKEKAKSTPYDRASVEHKTDYARIMDKHYAGWRQDSSMKAHAKIISQAMEGKPFYTAAGKISKTFINGITEMISAL